MSPKKWRRPKAKCPKCGFNLGHFPGVEGKEFRLAGEGELLSAIECPNCHTKLVSL